jgi:hypothetical protein
MTLACQQTSEWFGWSAAFLGTGGALMLVRPLFILLRTREALESLVYALDLDLAPDDLKSKFAEARTRLTARVFARRKNWKIWAYAGLALLLAALVLLCLQAICLF